ncbi:hypothetical protein B0H15DRAFT_954150 [Mycena belliarum]|uniref:Cytokinin riboside 5'-monophosphate phosphoribohydrolase n=1 Tax=Mycena belliarum TaxID=1033014 RepID=A0AAD6TVS4_9AGAR|nr:hypothetical protein B0H15DRAFT_954150 [Mycena belliae]
MQFSLLIALTLACATQMQVMASPLSAQGSDAVEVSKADAVVAGVAPAVSAAPEAPAKLCCVWLYKQCIPYVRSIFRRLAQKIFKEDANLADFIIMIQTASEARPKAVAVYCASTLGKENAYRTLGTAIAKADRALVYGGGTQGLMGLVASAVLKGGSSVTGIVPYAISIAGGEGSARAPGVEGAVGESSERVETIVVDSMNDRKTEMARRVDGFFGLPGGFGTLDEILEVITWTQIGFHTKPVILMNVLSYFEPLRQLIRTGIAEGFIPADNESFVIFVDGPAVHSEHESFGWGEAGLAALEGWDSTAAKPLFVWTEKGDN